MRIRMMWIVTVSLTDVLYIRYRTYFETRNIIFSSKNIQIEKNKITYIFLF